jgi:asparagine synthase (glutamine-hydrolysing)
MMAGLSNEPVNTCSIAFDDPRLQRVRVCPDGGRPLPHQPPWRRSSDDFDLIDTLARLYDEPYADSSAIPPTASASWRAST